IQTAWKNALEQTKARLENQIEDLEKQIANKEKRKVKRESIKLDQKAIELKNKRDELKDVLDELVGKPELTEEQKIKRAERNLELTVEKLTAQIADKDIEYREQPEPVTSAEIERLKNERQALQEEINRLRQEAGLVEKKRLKQTKTRLENQIEDLEKQIANKEKRKVKRESIKLDQKAIELKNKRDELKDVLDELVGKPELTEEQKIKRAERNLELTVEKLTAQIADKDIEYREQPEPVTSAEIERLKNERQALQEEINRLRQEAGLVEKKRLKQTKTRLENQIKTYQRRLREKDFAKREAKPVEADAEMQELLAEKIK